MRIVAGRAGGRRIQAPAGDGTRPTGDRVREAVFNALSSLGAVQDAVVVDLFAGSGAMGLEAWSRGAAEVTLVERNRAAVSIIEANCAALGAAEVQVVHAPVEAALAGIGTVDLVIADPPYAFAGWADLLGALHVHLHRDGLAVLETGGPIDLPDGWRKVRERTYGSTVVTFADAVDVRDLPGASA